MKWYDKHPCILLSIVLLALILAMPWLLIGYQAYVEWVIK